MPVFQIFKSVKPFRKRIKGGKIWTPTPPEERPHYISTSVYMTPEEAKQFDESMQKQIKQVLKDYGLDS